MQLAEATGARIIPVDSEHSALHQLIDGEGAGTVERLVLTASGGPFRGRTRAELAGVTVEEALQHPTWAMGGKITIDSATLMNKGLELIEAHHLFGTPYERIDVVVHPQSIVHSYVLLCDGAALAHLGHPDMRVPISYALHHPERVDVPVKPLDLAAVGALTFEPVDDGRVPVPAPGPRRRGGRRHRAVRAQRRQRDRRPRLPARPPRLPRHPRRDRGDARAPAAAAAARVRVALRGRPRGPRARRRARQRRPEPRVSYFLAFAGFAALIILHEFGHFAAAKAVGMRVERFSLFFPPLLLKYRRGETEYAVGAVPLGGYVKITGMNPNERIPPEIAHRAYFAQPVWKRVVVIAAGPFMNFLIAFVIIWVLLLSLGQVRNALEVNFVDAGSPAAGQLRAGDRILSIDGAPGDTPGLTAAEIRERQTRLRALVAKHTCAGTPTQGCSARTPATVVVTARRQAGHAAHRAAATTPPPRRCCLGIGYGQNVDIAARPRRRHRDVSNMWQVTEATVSGIVKIFYNPQARKEVSGVVGSFEVTRQTIDFDDDPRAVHPRADLAVARGRQPLPVPAARRRAHLLGAGREDPGPPDPVRGDGTGERRGLHAGRDAVHHRPDERHRAIDGQRLQRALSPRAG